MSSACDKYDLAETKLKAFTRSAVRTKVMLCLLEGELNAESSRRRWGSELPQYFIPSRS